MAITKNEQVLIKKREREGAKRKSNTLLKKAHELGELLEINVVIIIYN